MKFFNQWIRRLTPIESGILCLLFTTIFFIVFNIQFTRAHLLFTTNADILFIEEVARDLNAGANLFDWMLSQAPYLFPDIFLSRLIAYLSPQIGSVAGIYSIIFGIIIASLVFILVKVAKGRAFLPVCVALFFYLFMYTIEISGDYVSEFFGMIGCHSGVALILLITMIGLVLYQERPDSPWGIFLIFISLFIGTVSDSLIAFSTIPFLSAYLGLLWLKREISLKQVIQSIILLLSTIFLAKAFGWTNPFPQDIHFLKHTLNHFPESTFQSLVKFPKDFFYFFTSSPVSALIFVSFLGSFIIAALQLLDCYRERTQVKSVETLLALFILITPLFVLSTQIFLGIYQDIQHSRQWSPLVYLSIIFGALLFEARYPNRIQLIEKVFALTLLLNIGLMTYWFSRDRYQLPQTPEVISLIECMRAHQLPEGWLYAADYWAARPIRVYSENRYGVIALNGQVDSAPLLYAPASNIEYNRGSTPEFILTGYSISEERIKKQFGEPKAEYCAMKFESQDLKILDYRNNPAFKKHFREQALEGR